MTIEQVEKRVIELIHHQPFIPFVVELVDGQSTVVPHPRLAVNYTGAGFIDSDGALVDIQFKNVRAIRLYSEAVA